jgi:Flp pilus assembly pilin Flp
MPKLRRHGRDVWEKGQDAAEYALLIGLIALVIVLAVTALGLNLSAVFDAIQAGFASPF